MGVFLVLLRILRNVRRVVHDLEQIKKREDENPDQIDKVPEKAGYLDAVCQVFRVALIKFFADRQPHVNKDEHSAEHVHPMQTGDGEITGKICAVRWQKHGSASHVVFLDGREFVGG